MNDMMRLIEPLIPALRRYARALLRNPTDADDLVQDCLERAVGRWQAARWFGREGLDGPSCPPFFKRQERL